VSASLRQHFRPEFLNRIDEVVSFRSLSEEDLVAVTRIQLARVEVQLAERRINLQFPEGVVAWLAREGFDPQLGARPLKRLIQQVVVNPLSRAVLEGRLGPGSLAVFREEAEGLALEVVPMQ